MGTATEAPNSAVSLGDWVKVVNVDDHDITIQWNSREYVIVAGDNMFVPFEAAKLWFGDPRSGGNVASSRDVMGIVTWIPDRATEVRRLRALYDNQFGDERKIFNHPQVEVYTQAGARVYTVLEDVDGKMTQPAVITVNDQNDLREMVLRQQQLIEMLMAQREGSREDSVGDRGGSESVNDDPLQGTNANTEPPADDDSFVPVTLSDDDADAYPTTSSQVPPDDAV